MEYVGKEEGCKVNYCKKECGEKEGVLCVKDENDETKVTCKCSDNEMEFVGKEEGCKVDYCKKECGEHEGVICDKSEDDETRVTCTCADYEVDFVGKKEGCKVSSSTCIAKFPKCLFTGGICVLLVDKTIECACLAGTTFDEESGCKVLDNECNAEKSKCLGTGGFCFSDTDGKIECECPGHRQYSIEWGCKAANFCIAACGDKPDVKCSGDLTNKSAITCGCHSTSKLYYMPTKECKDDNCLEKCGIRYGIANDALKCEGNPFEEVECKCTDKTKIHDPKDKTCKTDFCKKKCGTVDCVGDKFKESEVNCKCGQTYEDFDKSKKECKVNYCKKVCGTNPGVECDGDEYEEKNLENCDCSGHSKQFDKETKQCRKQCSEDDKDKKCQNMAECVEDGKLKFCDCLKGTTGDFCGTITKCEESLKRCKGDKGDCVFEDKKAKCKCKSDKTEFFEKVGYCEDKCSKNEDCKNKKICNGSPRVCTCPDGLEGDKCEVITGCKELNEICKKVDAKCIFRENVTGKATCECNKEGFVYDDQKCKDPFCVTNPCKTAEQCVYDVDEKTGFCKCEEGEYYNYKKKKCEGLPDKCLLKKTACGKNRVCEDGECKCVKGYVEEEKECKPKLCDPNPCFNNADCNDKDGSCTCKEDAFYNGGKCEKFECDWNNYKENCTCPDGMERKEDSKNCEPLSGEKCEKNCGYGLCVKQDDKEVCKCFETFARKEKDTCILNVDVCATGKLVKDSKKCDCSDKRYTRAKDDITCKLITCSEASAKKDCDSKGATCNMRWKKDGNKVPGYYCECPKGYTEDNGKCTDPCSQNKNIEECLKQDQFCYNSVSEKNLLTGDCICPPTLELKDGKCSKLAENAYIIRNLPVLKKRYEMKSGINKVLLNTDIIQSMTGMFSEKVYGYGYLYDYKLQGDLLTCSVWINFKVKPGSELKRIKFQATKFPKNTTCEDCDETVTVWPPNLMLDGGKMNKIDYDNLTFCNSEVKNAVCGTYAECTNNTCSCPKGFRTAEFTLRQGENFIIQRCEDIDECSTTSHVCSKNTTCVNNPGDYGCQCKPGFKKNVTNPRTDKTACFDLCTPNPCKRGKCTQKGVIFDCECDPGVGGTYCHRPDVNYATAKKGTVIVGAVLGTILGLAVIAFLLYYRKIRKSSGSEDFMTAPRLDNAEMTERRPMRGVVNKSYE